ncbi:uncharacterized protein [Rutidosis leptorrhynchoides]|uniref:uncharacterized protein n=1 Tax=Rutidosis leptorrhynchoides TaxID=125765 RepID=UPI003A994246
MVCSLCNQVPDSHSHLFFVCCYSDQVWSLVAKHIYFPIICNGWKDFTALLSPFVNRNIACIIVTKLLFGATVNFLWQERNSRFFKKGRRSAKYLYDAIYSTVRLKLMNIQTRVAADRGYRPSKVMVAFQFEFVYPVEDLFGWIQSQFTSSVQ